MENAYAEFFEQVNAERQRALDEITSEINNKYKDEFEVFHIISTLGINEMRFLMLKKDEPDIRFNAVLSSEGDCYDDYLTFKCIKELKDLLFKDFDNLSVSISFVMDRFNENDVNISLDDFLKKHRPDHIIIRLAFDNNVTKDYEGLYDFIQSLNSKNGIMIACELFKFDSDAYKSCKELIEYYPNVTREMILNLNPAEMKNMLFENGNCTVDKSDFMLFMGGE
jgi:hypothetical protein